MKLKVSNVALPLLILLVTLIFVSSVNSSDDYDKSAVDVNNEPGADDDDLIYSESVRHIRLIDDNDREQWRAVQRLQTAEDERRLESRPQKRRRLRKRKRRPQQQQANDEQNIAIVRPRRRRPVRLDELEDDGWKEMEAESPHRSYSRRRNGPIYQEAVSSQETSEMPIRPTEHTTPLKDIKEILKQTGGLSLSEILLQKNFTLNDLLTGNHNAILALSERPLQSVTEKQMVTLPTIAAIIGEIRRKDEQRKRYTQENKLYSDITTKYDVVTESTTEKRIFVPSHPKYYTSINYKPEFDLATEPPKRTTLKLPMTSAQMHMKIKKNDGEMNNSKIQINGSMDMFGYESINKTSKGPLKMSFDLDELAKHNVILPEVVIPGETTIKAIETTTEALVTTTPMTTTLTSTTTSTTMVNPIQEETTLIYRPTSEKLTTIQRLPKKPLSTTSKLTMAATSLEPKISPSAKDEIMEIMRNDDVKEELTEILNSRNMTIEELVEQRERGSSQRHLAEIFHNNTREPEPTQTVEEINTRKLAPILPEPINNRRPKLISTTSTSTTITTTSTEPSTSIPSAKALEDVSLSSEEIIIADKLPSTSFPTYKIETNKISKEIPPLHIPIWKTIYPSIYIESEHNDKKLELDAIEQSIRQAVDDDLNAISRSNNNNLNEYDDYIQLPIGVKSAIFASLAIAGMSLVLFLTILIVFRWSQKHKKRICYGGGSSSGGSSTFTCSKIKSPILQHEPKRTIRTFVSETLGKRRNFYAQHFRQSMSDSWESNERPYQ